jgi:hypothetical protein
MEKSRKSHLLVSLLILIPTQCIFLPVNSLADYLTLSWDLNHEPDLAGYRIYYGKSSGNYDYMTDVGNVSFHSLSDLEPDKRYYLALTAYDISGNESDFSNEVSGISSPDPPSSNPSHVQIGSGSGCFIATAAYGSYLNPHVKTLRDFRDGFLTSNSLGRKFVRVYYQYGPRIANHIGKYGFLRYLTRQVLLPLVGMSLFSLQTTASQEFLLLSFCCLFIFTVALRLRRSQAL